MLTSASPTMEPRIRASAIGDLFPEKTSKVVKL